MSKKSVNEINSLIKQLRNNLADVLPSNKKFDNNFYLYKWLLQNQMKIGTTEHAIRKSIEWRRKVNLEELAEREWAFYAPGLEKEISISVNGIAKTGQPVSTTNGDDLDLRELISTYGKDSLIRYFYQYAAKLEKSMMDHYQFGPTSNSDIIGKTSNSSSFKENKGERPSYNSSWDSASLIHIASFKNFSLSSLMCVEGIQVLLEGAKAGMTYFPAAVSMIYFVNFNKFSKWAVKSLKPIIVSDLLNVEVFDTEQSKWSEVLLERIDANQLHTHLGGNLIDKACF